MPADEILLVTGDVRGMPVEALHLYDGGVCDDDSGSDRARRGQPCGEFVCRHEVRPGGVALAGCWRGHRPTVRRSEPRAQATLNTT
jgi:hypothetical protein